MVKYIRTREGKIIAFPTYISHADYLEYCPVSAGFIEISHSENGRLEWKCFGNSISLGLDSKEAEDTLLLHQQIGIDQLKQNFF